MTVADVSVLVAAISVDGSAGDDIRHLLAGRRLSAPEVVDLEVAASIRAW